MKKIIVIALLLTGIHTSAQQVTCTDSVTHTVITPYIGVLSGPQVSVSDGTTTGFVTIRIGGIITWTPSKMLSFYGLGAGEIDQKGTVTSFSHIGVKFAPIKSVLVTVGKIGTPMAELRPLPHTSGGQFEPWTPSHIPGSAIGGKITFTTSKQSAIIGGAFIRGSEISHELGLRISHMQLAGYYLGKSKQFGGALKYTNKMFSTTLMYNDRQNAGMLDVFEIPKTHGLSIYSDIGFDTNTWNMIRGEWGIFKPFTASYMQALLGVGYTKEVHAMKGYIFIHL